MPNARPRLASSGNSIVGLHRQVAPNGRRVRSSGVELRVAGGDLGHPGVAVVLHRRSCCGRRGPRRSCRRPCAACPTLKPKPSLKSLSSSSAADVDDALGERVDRRRRCGSSSTVGEAGRRRRSRGRSCRLTCQPSVGLMSIAAQRRLGAEEPAGELVRGPPTRWSGRTGSLRPRPNFQVSLIGCT